MTSAINHLTPEQIALHVRNLQAIGDRLEAAGDPDWLPIARAAMTLEAMRIGAADIVHESTPMWIGIDMGTGDRTVHGGSHHA